jgi:hypothetical protein
MKIFKPCVYLYSNSNQAVMAGEKSGILFAFAILDFRFAIVARSQCETVLRVNEAAPCRLQVGDLAD